MDPENYVELASRTEKQTDEYLMAAKARLSRTEVFRLLHAGMGMVTEAGEFMDALKKFVFYGKPIDRGNLVEEIGDQCFYIALACRVLEVDLSEAMRLNIEKLEKRYGGEFSCDAALNRDLDCEQGVFESARHSPAKMHCDSCGTYVVGTVCLQDPGGDLFCSNCVEARKK